jgi:maltose alpha-D-glucosyltransferase/alpha-amylase
MQAWAGFWTHWTSVVFLRAYLRRAREGAFLPADEAELRILLDANVLHKAMYELGYELNNRPAWLRIPVRGILQLMERKR